MTRNIPKQKNITDEKAATERYLGKRELLKTLDQFPDADRGYRNRLKKRVDMLKRDLIYRGLL